MARVSAPRKTQNTKRKELILMCEKIALWYIFGIKRKAKLMMGFEPATCRFVRFLKRVIIKKFGRKIRNILVEKYQCESAVYQKKF